MAKNMESGEASRDPPPNLPPSKLRRSQDPFLVVCRCFRFVTGAVAILCVVANILGAIRSFRNGSDIFGGIFRCYAVALSIFVAVAETEWNYILKFGRVFEYWVGRGMLQIFVAVMTRAFPDVNWDRRDLVLLQEFASYLLLACGVIYIISGLLCIGFLKRARQQRDISRDEAARDLRELERKKQELEALLMQPGRV